MSASVIWRRRLAVAALLAPGLVAAGTLPAGALGAPAAGVPSEPAGVPQPTTTTLSVPAVPAAEASTRVAGDELVAERERTATDDFQLVGVTWAPGPDPADLTAEVRTRKAGTWSAWQQLDVENAAEPGARGGTEPLWVGDADGVAARVLSTDGEAPADIEIATIDSPEQPGDEAVAARSGDVSLDSSALAATTAAVGVQSAAAQPAIVLRGQWGAKSATCSYANNARQQGAVLHHTAGGNTYTQAQAPGVVRATQAYHKDQLKWCDLGYNFLVDKYGTIYEGRVGGITRMVRGAHSGKTGSNTAMVGVSMMGNYDTAGVTTPLKNSVAALIAWRFSIGGTPATGYVSMDGRTLNRIAGHRDIKATACPGKYGYAWLNQAGAAGLRGMVVARMGGAVAPPAAAPRLTGTILSTYTRYKAYLGSSTSSILKAKRGYTYANFSNGRVYAKGSKGYALWGAIDKAHRAAKGTSGFMGVPVASEQYKRGGALARFSGGRIYAIGRGVYYSWGKVDAKHRKLRGVSGRLGYPTRSVYRTSKGNYRATYRGGSISYNPKSRKYSVKYR